MRNFLEKKNNKQKRLRFHRNSSAHCAGQYSGYIEQMEMRLVVIDKKKKKRKKTNKNKK
jgi:hypothetical protein